MTRHTANPLRAHADLSLVVSAHDERRTSQPLLYQSALQHLLDGVFVLLCEGHDDRHAQPAGQPRPHPADAGAVSSMPGAPAYVIHIARSMEFPVPPRATLVLRLLGLC